MNELQIRIYDHLYTRVEYKRERGYRMEYDRMPDWIYITITTINETDTKYLTVHSRYHVGKDFRINPDYTSAWSDQDIIKDLSREVYRRFIDT